VHEYVQLRIPIRQGYALLSADSDGQVLPAALWRPDRLALCLYMVRGVILRSAGLLGAPVAFMRGADKDTGSNFSWR
jgi:hypothetical protein